MPTRIGSNRIANGAITIEKISQTTITALGDASSISNANSNVFITGANGNVGITIAGNTQSVISANLITHNEGVLESIMFRVNTKNVTSNITISNTYNYMSVGPIAISNGVTVTIANDAFWTIV